MRWNISWKKDVSKKEVKEKQNFRETPATLKTRQKSLYGWKIPVIIMKERAEKTKQNKTNEHKRTKVYTYSP